MLVIDSSIISLLSEFESWLEQILIWGHDESDFELIKTLLSYLRSLQNIPLILQTQLNIWIDFPLLF